MKFIVYNKITGEIISIGNCNKNDIMLQPNNINESVIELENNHQIKHDINYIVNGKIVKRTQQELKEHIDQRELPFKLAHEKYVKEEELKKQQKNADYKTYVMENITDITQAQDLIIQILSK